MTLRLGTRGSALALAQSGTVARALEGVTGQSVDLVTIRSEGDELTGPLAELGTTGVFATRLRRALLAGECDLLVHSFKDLPVEPYSGLTIAAVPGREDPRDALCARDGLALAELPHGARVGTGSPRRAAALLAERPDLVTVPIRGNVDTRLGLVTSGAVDAVVLAAAGLARLGRSDAVTELLALERMLPAPAQGALAIETLVAPSDRPAGLSAGLAALDDPAAHAAVRAERAVLAELEAGCSAPIGALAQVEGGELALHARVVHPAGTASAEVRVSGAIADPEALGRTAGIELRRAIRDTPGLAGVLA